MDNPELNNLKEFREIPFSKLSLSDKHEKLLKRICNINSSQTHQISETIGGILDLEPYDFSKIPAIGKSYVDSLITLKKELLNEDTDNVKENEEIKSLIGVDDISFKFSIIPSSLSELHLNYHCLKKDDVKLIEKLEKLYGSLSIEDILDCAVIELKGEKGLAFGAKHSTALKNLQDQLREEIIFIVENNKLPINQVRLLVSSKIKFYDMSKIDEILIEDIENYLWSLDEKQQDIALSRWGFNHDNETLEEVGERHSLTRERVRQLEKQINTYLPLYLRIHPKVLWANIREKMGLGLTVSLPFLSQYFDTEKLFYSFIETCCQIKKGSLIEITLPKVQRRLLEPFFCLNPSPVAHDVLVEELTSEFGYSRALAEITIKKLVELGSIKITERGIKPQNMKHKEAIAHALTFHQEGLPWKDVLKIVNKQGFSKSKINEDRMASGFSDSDYIYLCSHGNYRNLIFLDLESFDLKPIMQHIVGYFKSHNIEALNLHYYFQQTINERPPIEYFALRHLVRVYGEEFGLYFNGRSGVDNVSVNEVSERITQWDVVVQALNQSKGAMTRPEIAERLRSKSLNHAGYYLNELMEENKVVRIDNQMFSTPEKAFKDINSNEILSIIKKLMHSTNKIVEADVFRKHVNHELNLSYSKYFYAALVGLNLKELGWHRTNNFISNTPLEYKKLLHVYKSVCQQSLSNAVNISRVKEILWITDSVAANTLQQWKWLLKQ